MSSIQLPEDWRRRVEMLVADEDERTSILQERKRVEEKLRRLKVLYRDMVISDEEYQADRERLQAQLDTLVLPSNPNLIDAGEYLENLERLWAEATLAEQMALTRALVRNVYVDVEAGSIVSIEPQSVLRMLFTSICDTLAVDLK